MMAGKIEIRKSGEKFRFIVLNRSGEKLLAERTVRRQGEREAGRILTREGCKRCGDPRRDQAGRRHEAQRTSPGREPQLGNRRTTSPIRAIRSIPCRPRRPRRTARKDDTGASPPRSAVIPRSRSPGRVLVGGGRRVC